MEKRTPHRISVKVAIYSPDGKSILTTNMPLLKNHGLPGGHLNLNEDPLEALKRELFEELAIDDAYDFQLKASWWHKERLTGRRKLVLGYTAKRDNFDLPAAPYPENEFGEWLLLSDVTEQDMSSYALFIKSFQPRNKARLIFA